MDNISKSAVAFKNLLNKKYHIVIGKKGKEIEIDLSFLSVDFHHLAGLHKLKDLRLARDNREDVFFDILNDKITDEFITKSRYFDVIKERVFTLSQIENLLDKNEIVFKYYKKYNSFSVIDASYLFEISENKNSTFIFIDKRDDGANNYFCRSFFPKKDKDYTKGQERWTLLYKEKINLDTGVSIVQYQHPSYKTPMEQATEQLRRVVDEQSAIRRNRNRDCR